VLNEAAAAAAALSETGNDAYIKHDGTVTMADTLCLVSSLNLTRIFQYRVQF